MFEEGISQKEPLLSLLESPKLIFEMQSSIRGNTSAEEVEQPEGYKNKCFEIACTQQKHTSVSIKGYAKVERYWNISFSIKSKISHKCSDNVAMT